jgi:hypothetical protein
MRSQMERVMQARLAMISAAALATIAAAREPTKPVATPNQLTQPTVLASADHVRAPVQPAEPPKKARAARVTTCRCGDQIVEPAEEPKDR